MAIRRANAVWQGGLKGGKGEFSTAHGGVSGAYSFTTRFEEEPGTNPEELIGAAHAACYSMAFSAGLERAGFIPERVSTSAEVQFEKLDAGWRITKITLNCEAKVPGIDEAAFQSAAAAAKEGCPISNALKAEIALNATLLA